MSIHNILTLIIRTIRIIVSDASGWLLLVLFRLLLEYGYNNQQYPYPMNSNYNVPPNMNENYDGRQGNPYPANNYFNPYGQPRGNSPYYTGNTGGQWYPNFGDQQRSNGAIPPMYVNQRPAPRRR